MKKKVTYFVILLILLFFTRVLYFSILSSLVNKEHFFLYESIPHYQKNYDKIKYENLGFCLFGNAKDKLLEKAKKIKKEGIIILKFFDFICPTRYLIFNKGEETLICFPWPWVDREFEEGITEVNIYQFDYVKIKDKNKSEGFFAPIVGTYDFFYKERKDDQKKEELIKKKSAYENKIGINDYDIGSIHLSYFYYENSIFLIHIHFFYFFPPLIVILLLLQKYKIHLAYLYFIIMTLIFTPKYFMFYASSLGMKDRLFWEPIGLVLPLLITILFGVLFIRNIRIGLKLLKEKKLELKEKFIILYFLLLPIFLRF